MQPKFTLKRGRIASAILSLVFLFAGVFSTKTQAQTVISTDYTAGGLTFLTGDALVTFSVTNSNPVAITLNRLDCYAATVSTPGSTTGTLWYSSTSLSGAPTVTSPAWTQIATGSPVNVTTDDFYTFLSGINFSIPANTTYRFAFQSSNGLIYANATTAPNNFTLDGVTLGTGSYQISGANVGYTGASPSGTITPRFFYGELEFSVPVCTGTPAPGNTQVSAAAGACPGVNFTLSLQNTTGGTGVSYQWQSATASTGPWTNITGATASTYTTNQTTDTYYRCNVTCSGNTGTSSDLLVPMAPTSACYCIPAASNCSLSDVITNVTLGTLNNSSACAAGGYTFYNSVTVPNLIAGAVNPISVTVGPGGTENVGAWVDWNQNGTFEPSEYSAIGSGNGSTVTGGVTVGAGATLGQTRMRVRVRWSTAISSSNACTTFSFGETEDYLVNIVPCVPITIATPPANRSIMCGTNTTFTVNATGSLPVYGWQYRTSATSTWQTVTNGGIYSGATTPTLSLTNVSAAYNGYQYRALVSGGCSAVDFSSVATLTVTPIIANLSVSSASICTGSIQPITLTNASSPSTVTFTNTSTLAIPDATPNGVWSTINVSGIPANAVISDISVKLNITHTYVGDLEINLLAPNGQNMNLIGELDNGSGSNSSDDFTNTVISSTGTVAMSGAAAPRTGTFRADRLLGYGPSLGPGGVGTGYQTVSGITWAQLQTLINGDWKLGLSDWYSGDAGTLLDWSIAITYGSPATGVWTASPASPNTMFTDAAATVPYVAGAQATTIYVNPTATTTYSVVYTSGTPCTSNPTPVTVSVSNPVTGVVNPANRSVCVGGNVTFTTSASGGPLTYQWQRSTDAGLTWSNISGATATSLTLTEVPQTANAYRYRCVISAGPCGSVTTTAATLTVNALPNVTLSTTAANIIPGVTTTLTASSTPAAGATNSWSWTLNGATISGNTATQSATVDALGTYQATVTDVNGCVNTSNELVIAAEASDKLWIYPNPTPGAFQVRLYHNGNTAERRKVSVYDVKGRLITSKTFDLTYSSAPYQSMTFDLSGMARGTYVVKVANEYSGKVISGLVLVH